MPIWRRFNGQLVFKFWSTILLELEFDFWTSWWHAIFMLISCCWPVRSSEKMSWSDAYVYFWINLSFISCFAGGTVWIPICDFQILRLTTDSDPEFQESVYTESSISKILIFRWPDRSLKIFKLFQAILKQKSDLPLLSVLCVCRVFGIMIPIKFAAIATSLLEWLVLDNSCCISHAVDRLFKSSQIHLLAILSPEKPGPVSIS